MPAYRTALTLTPWVLALALLGDGGCLSKSSQNGNVPIADLAVVLDATTTDDAGDPGQDLGAPDAASPIDASTPSCATTGVALCEDFESGAIDTTNWTVDGQTPTIDSTRAARGKYSLHFQIPSGTTPRRSWIYETKTFPAANDSFYGRTFVYLTAMPLYHMGIVEGFHAKTPASVYAVGTGNHDLLVNYKSDLTGVDNGVSDKMPFPLNQWVCLEWQFDGVGNTVHVWIDGVADTAATLTGYTAPQFDRLVLGIALYGMPTTPPDPTYDMWLDEIAVDSARITCNR
jgi:hypothetical protein